MTDRAWSTSEIVKDLFAKQDEKITKLEKQVATLRRLLRESRIRVRRVEKEFEDVPAYMGRELLSDRIDKALEETKK